MKLSIIIPCYNAEIYIERCVHSILKQKDHRLTIEMFLCNDGSKDNTLEILLNLKDSYSDSIQVIDHLNQGVYKTRNQALGLVTGDFVWLIDADDTIEDSSLQKIESELMPKPDTDILTFGYKVQNSNNSISTIYPPILDYPALGINYLSKNDGRLFLWFNIYRMNFLHENSLRFLGKSMSLEDSLFNIQAFTYAKKVIGLQAILYNYHYNEGSISKLPSLENRLKQGQSSINVHLALKDFRDTFDITSITYKIINTKLKHSILGFFFSLIKEKYPTDYIKKIITIYTKSGLYPIPMDSKLNLKAKAFRKLINRKQILLLLSEINQRRK